MFHFVKQVLIFSLLFWVLFGCSSTKQAFRQQNDDAIPISGIRFLSEYDLPHLNQFKGTTIGGLSGIDYDSASKIYYLISDDRSAINPARFYTAKIRINRGRIDSIEFADVISLLQKNGQLYPNSTQDPGNTPDPEALRFNPLTNELVWSSEGERIVKDGKEVLEDPAVIIADKNGRYKDSFALPANMHMQSLRKGPRQNGVFEGLTFVNDHRSLYVSVEEPLYEDGERAATGDSAAWIRIIKFDAVNKKPLAQYAYRIEPVAHPANPAGAFKINGVSDILYAGAGRLIVIERSFSTGTAGCVIRVYLAGLYGADDISSVGSLLLHPPARPVSKKLLLNMDSLHRYIDNVEGVTFGPMLSNGHRSLLFVVDDNFSPLEKTQFLLFEVIP